MKSFTVFLFVGLLSASAAQAQLAPPQPAPHSKSPASPITIKKGDAVRTGETRPGKAPQSAGEGTFGESRTVGSLAPRPTQPTPTGQPPQ